MDTGFVEHGGNCSVRAFGTHMDGSEQHCVQQRAHCPFFPADMCVYIESNRIIEAYLVPSIYCIAPHTPFLVIRQPSIVIARVSTIETSPPIAHQQIITQPYSASPPASQPSSPSSPSTSFSAQSAAQADSQAPQQCSSQKIQSKPSQAHCIYTDLPIALALQCTPLQRGIRGKMLLRWWLR